MYCNAPMQKQRQIYLDRLDRFTSSSLFTDVNLYGKRIKRKSSETVKLTVYSVPMEEQPGPYFEQIYNRKFVPICAGQRFGPSWSTHWFHILVEMPPSWTGEKVYFKWDSGCEALVWTSDGDPVQGFSDGRNDYLLTKHAKPSELFEFYVEMACNGMFGNPSGGAGGIIAPPNQSRFFTLNQAEIVVYNEEALKLFRDFSIIADIARHMPSDWLQGGHALFAANQIINHFDRPDDPDSWTHAQAIADAFLAVPNGPGQHEIVAIGHCHIDSAWLWDYAETRRKCARSWASQIAIMDEFPEFRFACSQMQQFEWMRKKYPRLFDRIKEKVKVGQYIPIGGTWVEMDCNLPSGESIIRQFLHGQFFMKKHFERFSKVFWLPDTFGYNAQLPQIMKHAGVKYFFSQKLSWNKMNSFPHHSFMWEGLDGTKVLCHFPPSDTYTASATVQEVLKTQRNNKDLDRSRSALLVYGHGDGGGGPTLDMVDRLVRMKDVDGLARISMKDPEEFFEDLEKSSKQLLTWRGELYFELHRGTYTSQARTKLYNRHCEDLLRDAEILSILSAIIIRNGSLKEYPAKTLDKLWKKVLLNQFHDVLPGSSIGKVYADTDKMYEEVIVKGAQIQNNAIKSICESTQWTEITDDSKGPHGTFFINSLPFVRSEVVQLPYDDIDDSQSIQGGFVLVEDIPGMAIFTNKAIKLKPGREAEVAFVDPYYVMQNGFVEIRFDKQGHITSYYDKNIKRQIIPEGEIANRIMLYDDVPIYWDAWDVELYHLEKCWTVQTINMEIQHRGPLLASLVRTIKISDTSTMTQIISLSCVSPRLDFRCRVQWNEKHKMLKAQFPVAIRSEFASYETQFGIIQRPTHMNTSWDVARFEVCAQRFADLSEFNYGVALLNDSKYGYSVQGNVISLSLLRAPKMPDPDCDMGVHDFQYSLFPHPGTVHSGSVLAEAMKFNRKLLWTSARTTLDPTWFDQRLIWIDWKTPTVTQTETPPLILETIKAAEDGNGDVVMRIYEPHGGHGTAVLGFHAKIKVRKIQLCDALEQAPEDALCWSDEDKGWILAFAPFKIYTMRISLQTCHS